jgi:hypothetical protein
MQAPLVNVLPHYLHFPIQHLDPNKNISFLIYGKQVTIWAVRRPQPIHIQGKFTFQDQMILRAPDLVGESLYTKEEVQIRITEHVLGVVKGKEGKVAYLNFLLDVTQECARV